MSILDIRGTTRIAAVIGYPIEHSRSPELMNAAFEAAELDAVMVPIGAPPEGFEVVVAALRMMQAIGASVTVPHKLAAAAACDELSAAARQIGAVNCLELEGDRLIGHNTDAGGFTDGLAAAGFQARGTRAVLLGAGGAARAVAYGLREVGAAATVIARRPDQVTWTQARPWTGAELREGFARAELVVDCTPAGLGGAAEEAAFVDELPLDALRPAAWIATLIYHRRTILLERASARGHSILDGRAMLVHQGARAFTIWTDRPAPVAAMTQALDAALDGT